MHEDEPTTEADRAEMAAEIAHESLPEHVDLPDHPLDPPQESTEVQPVNHFIVITTNENGIPLSITPQGLPITAVPESLRIASAMVVQRINMLTPQVQQEG